MRFFSRIQISALAVCLFGISASVSGIRWPFQKTGEQVYQDMLEKGKKDRAESSKAPNEGSKPQTIVVSKPTSQPIYFENEPGPFALLQQAIKDLGRVGWKASAHFLKKQWKEHPDRIIVLAAAIVVRYLYERWNELLEINAVLDGIVEHKRDLYSYIPYFLRQKGRIDRVWNQPEHSFNSRVGDKDLIAQVKNEVKLLKKYKNYFDRSNYGLLKRFVMLFDSFLWVLPYIPTHAATVPLLGKYFQDTRQKVDDKYNRLFGVLRNIDRQ